MFWWIYSILSTILVSAVLVLGLTFWIRRKIYRSAKPGLRKENWEKDVVYLIQFPCVPNARTVSPFSLKVETWLRLQKIKYENVYTLKFGSKGQIPYIELNGQEIPDSNVILDKLEEHFKVSATRDVKDRSVSHAITIMLENHTAKVGFYWRLSLIHI